MARSSAPAPAVLALCVACTSASSDRPDGWTDGAGETGVTASDTGADPGDTADTADSGEPDPWEDPAFWSSSSYLDELLDLSLAPDEPHFEVRVAEADASWTTFSDLRTVAHSFSSLDLLVLEDGLVLLGGVDARGLSDARLLEPGALFALVSPDGERFGTTVIEVRDEVSRRFTDPALFVTDAGEIRAVYYSTPEDQTMDPAIIPGAHDLRVAVREGAAFRELPDVVFSKEWLVDPVICRADDGWHLFATEQAGVIHATGATPDAFAEDGPFDWSGNQVPHCSPVDGSLTVLAQAGGGGGAPSVRALSADGTFTTSVALWGEDEAPFEATACTSPVRGTFRGRNLLFCAMWVGG